jgi:ribosomal protein L7Ae-like RNA K-turn-binding protein
VLDVEEQPLPRDLEVLFVAADASEAFQPLQFLCQAEGIALVAVGNQEEIDPKKRAGRI